MYTNILLFFTFCILLAPCMMSMPNNNIDPKEYLIYSNNTRYNIKYTSNVSMDWIFEKCKNTYPSTADPISDMNITTYVSSMDIFDIYVSTNDPTNDVHTCMMYSMYPTSCIPYDIKKVVNCVTYHKTTSNTLSPGMISVIVIAVIITIMVLFTLIFCIFRIYCRQQHYVSVF